MRKIANVQELQVELQRLLQAAQEPRPRRKVMAKRLQKLARMVSGSSSGEDTTLDPRHAMVYFDLAFEDYNIDEDAKDPDAVLHDIAVKLKGRDGDREAMRIEHDAFREVSKMFPGFHIVDEGHNEMDLVCKFGVDSYEDVKKVWDIVQRHTGGGDDECYLDAPYSSVRGFRLYPQGVNGPSIGAGERDGDFDDWLEDNKP